jgi:hypothetical protein
LLHNPNEALDRPGAFCGNPYPGAVNHSLWTLQPELFCYLLLAGMGALNGLRRRNVILLVCLLAYFGFAVNLLRSSTAEGTLWRFIAYFACGVVFYMYRDVITLHSRWVLLTSLALLVIGVVFRPCFSLFLPAAGGYILFSLAFARWTPLWRIFAGFDLSYGMYIYAWPIQQGCVYSLGISNPIALFAVSLPIIATLATASWIFVERPFLGRKIKGMEDEKNLHMVRAGTDWPRSQTPVWERTR